MYASSCSFLFHEVTSLHPPSFHRNDFSTCSTHFSLGVCAARAHVDSCTRMPTRTTPPFYARVMHAYVMASFSVCPWRAPRSTVGIYGERKTIAWCPCTSPSTLEMFGGKISASPGSSKEIAGLLRKMIMMMMMMMKMTRTS